MASPLLKVLQLKMSAVGTVVVVLCGFCCVFFFKKLNMWEYRGTKLGSKYILG